MQIPWVNVVDTQGSFRQDAIIVHKSSQSRTTLGETKWEIPRGSFAEPQDVDEEHNVRTT